MRKRPLPHPLAVANLLWEVPLALASFAAFRFFARLMRVMVVRHFRSAGSEASRWRPLSAETLKKPIALPLLMASAPRWNTHAIVATVGPLRVARTLSIDLAIARRSAASWTAVVYTFPDFRTVAHVGSQDPIVPGETACLDLEPGDYWIGLRYYDWGPDVVLPSISVDGRETVAAEPVASDVNDFYLDLARRSNLVYGFLHFHAYIALKYKDYLPRRFVDRIVLPVGNPETRFEYGALLRGRALQVEVTGQAGVCDVFLTLYTPSSFPISWCRIDGPSGTTPPSDRDRMYLIRIHRRSDSAEVEGSAVRIVEA